ncbi:Structural maintenance of chromosomes protein 4 [Tupaia chinensis]|uniref:Structural maintenance of chromosomes protein 4 n=1 Tax=Tupaia chinensis TaxID=246437 RepID=L8YAM6_TUPCH|nr:Structural maintenance of chromosomes protein 4 [Tupaia chinensis]
MPRKGTQASTARPKDEGPSPNGASSDAEPEPLSDGAENAAPAAETPSEELDNRSLEEILNSIPPPPPPAMTNEAGAPRLMITHIVNQNFKSYAGEKILGPFHKRFSCIIGPNGSGKSNVIDSMLFVFGYRAQKIRSKKLSVLIHNSDEHKDIQSCTVEVHFQKIIDKEGDDYEVIPDSNFYVSRTAYRDNTSVYHISGKKKTFKDVGNLLRSHGIDLDHNRFLILQVEEFKSMPAKSKNIIAETTTRSNALEKEKEKEEEKLKEVMDSLKQETQGLQKEKESREKELMVFSKSVNEARSKMDVAQSELDIYLSCHNTAVSQLSKAKEALIAASETLKERKAAIEDIEAKLPQAEKELKEKEKELQKLTQEEINIKSLVHDLFQKVEDAKSSLAMNRSRGKVLDAIIQEKKSGRIPGIYGRLGDLGAIDEKYDVAISSCCHALDYIVVDSIDTAQQCVNFLKRKNIGVATFIGLDKRLSEQEEYLNIQVKELEANVLATAPDQKKQKSLEENVSAFKKEYDGVAEKAGKVEAEVKRLHDLIVEINNHKLKAQQDKLDKINKQLDECASAITKAQVAIKTADRNLKKAQESVLRTEKEIRDTEKEVNDLTAELKSLEDKAADVVNITNAAEACMFCVLLGPDFILFYTFLLPTLLTDFDPSVTEDMRRIPKSIPVTKASFSAPKQPAHGRHSLAILRGPYHLRVLTPSLPHDGSLPVFSISVNGTIT